MDPTAGVGLVTLREAIRSALDAADEEQAARDAFSGESFGYFFRSVIEDSERADAALEAKINAMIDARIAAAKGTPE